MIRIGEQAWAWVRAAVPPPLRYKWLYTHFKRAAASVGTPELTLHDLRHFHGQLLSDAGMPEARIQQSLRHGDPKMTRRYTRARDVGQVAATMDGLLFPSPAPEDGAEEA